MSFDDLKLVTYFVDNGCNMIIKIAGAAEAGGGLREL